MSLLMDALRKAEQQKQKISAQGQQPELEEGSVALELEPLSISEAQQQADISPALEAVEPVLSPANGAGKPDGNNLPELPAQLADLDEQFLAHAAKAQSSPRPAAATTPPPPAKQAVTPPRANSSVDASRENARKLFEAKQPVQKSNRSFAIAVGLITLVASVGIGGYFWWQLQPKGGLVASPGPTPPQAAPAPIAAAQPPINVASPASAVPPAPTFAPPATPAIKPSAMHGTTANAEEAIPPPPPRAAAKPTPQPEAQPQSPIRLATSIQKTNPLLEQAYQAFNRGEIDLARLNWQKVIATDPRNADALHGLAAVAQQRQQPNEAAEFYLRALEADPRDALALSGLVSLRTPADTQQTESRLKTLLADQPNSPYLNFALGNLHARGMRWAEAQQAFFRAHTADPANPDYLFNLAVSLDQLHQPRLAVQYYNQALAAAAQQPAGFDAAGIMARLKILQSSLQR